MAGQLTIDTLKASSGVLATQNGMTGIAKAWVNFNGLAGASVRNSFNVSSVTYVTTGTYTVNFTTAMPNANYVIVGAAGLTEANNHGIISLNTTNTGADVAPTTAAFTFITSNNISGTADNFYVNISVFGS